MNKKVTHVPMRYMKILKILIIPILILSFFLSSHVTTFFDSLTIRQVKICVQWIENFYIENARYPSQSELYSYDSRCSSWYLSYNGPENRPETQWDFFNFNYSLFKENENALGQGGTMYSMVPGIDFSPRKASYEVIPCRWKYDENKSSLEIMGTNCPIGYFD